MVLALPQAREACPHNLAPTTSALMQLALGDALAIALLESHGFTAVDFGQLHPGGKLGTLLKAVRDLMHSGDSRSACAARHQNVGCDPRNVRQGLRLRRHRRSARADWSASSPTAICAATCATICSTPRVDDVMTRAPKTVRPDQLISETLELLNSTKVTALFAVEAGKPVGVIHVHDLLRAGAA